jgi:glycosyltransferase involved in cell wall biosynthesis
LTNLRKLRYLAWALKARQILLKIKPDILHAHGVVSAGWLGAATGYHPYLVTAHGSDLILLDQRDWFFQLLTKWAILKADYVTCVSENLAIRAKALGVKPENVEVVHLGVDLDIFHPSSNPKVIRHRSGLGEAPLVLSIRAMKPIYNQLDIAKAIPIILEQISQVRFLIFVYNADHGYLTDFKTILAKEINSGVVKLVHDLPDDQAIAEYYQACDIAISVPSSDGTPKSVQEAMACGIPVVVSDLPSLHEWITSEKEGLYVPVGDVQAISQAIIRLLLDKSLRRELGQRAYEKILQHGDPTRWEQRAENIYHELANQRKN